MSAASQVEREMLALINQERTSRGLDPLQLETQLNDSSEDHSSWMLDTDTFSHTGSGGSSATQRMQAAGFDLEGSWRTGENIAWQSERGAPGISDDVAQLHQGLMNSPGHRANILNPDFKYIGIGIETGDMQGSDAVIVTQNFATTDAAVMLDSGGTAMAPTPPAEPDPAQPDTDVTETEDPVTEQPDTDVTETDNPSPEQPDTDLTETDDSAPEQPGTDVTDNGDPAPEQPDTEDADADCFDVAAFLTELDAFIQQLKEDFDQFAWNDDDMTPLETQDDMDFVIVDDSVPVADEPICPEMTSGGAEDFFSLTFFSVDCMMDAA
ncbi:hypothetical protein NBRC116589_14440 [Ruegeria sp. HU-ET01832]|uniref:CAP domain-containing protein n=1 Tax=Ruegeria sp. HU-ET01832 TaxID=3135906 RepID=UPI00310C7DD3